MEIQNKLLLTPSDIKPTFPIWSVRGVLNPGAIRLPNKKIMLMVRVAEQVIQKPGKAPIYPFVVSKKDYSVRYGNISEAKVVDKGRNVVYLKGGICRLTTISHLRRVFLSEDGFSVEDIDKIPSFVGAPGDGEFGVEDARIIKMGNRYVMNYVSVCLQEGVCTSLAVSKNLKDWDRRGIIFRQQNKDVVIFPEKINGKYVALHRPEGTIFFSKKTIWISHSPDLIHWGEERSIMASRHGSWGESYIGSGAPPVKIKEGWLLFYHGVKIVNDENIYSVGAALLDRKNPEKILARTPVDKPLIRPSFPYERKGAINEVVFPTGAVPDLNGKDILIYSGGADSVVTVKKINIKDILDSLEYY